MNYIRERQFCFRLNLARPEHEELCIYLENRDRKKYPYLASYLLAACQALEKREQRVPESRICDDSMQKIRETVLEALQQAEMKESRWYGNGSGRTDQRA